MREDRPFLVWSSKTEQEDFLKKKKIQRGTLGNSPAATAPASSSPHPLAAWHSYGAMGDIEPKCEAQGESGHLGGA